MVFGVAWHVAGIAVPIALAVLHPETVAHSRPLWAVLALVLAISANYSLKFGSTEDAATLYPGGAALIIGALFLTPIQAMLMCAPAFLFDVTGYRQKGAWWKLPASGALTSIGLGVTSYAIHSTFHAVSIGELLPAALIAATCFMAVDTVQYAVSYQLRIGAGLAFLRSIRVILLAEIVLAASMAVLAGTYHNQWPLMLLVLAAAQATAYGAARVTTSENLHRQKSAYLQDTFSRYVPEHVADQLANSGEELKLGGEEREISVLFCDIRGFTSWSEKVEPEVVIAELNSLLGALSDAVMEHGGTLDKYTGDGLMAFWGAPLDQPTHAELATSAALAMLRALGACNEHRAAIDLPPFAIGVGVHSGRAVVGNVGSERRLDYTAIGDTVNLAARLEAATKDAGSPVLLSSSTHAGLYGELAARFESAGSITVKGRIQPVDVVRLRVQGLANAERRAA
jgi:class 3 adenylate cyclase